MNLLQARVVLRPRSASDILDLAAPFCLQGGRYLGVLVAIVLLPLFAASWAARAAGWTPFAIWLLTFLLGDLFEGIFTAAAGELLFQEPRALRARRTLLTFLRRLPAYLVVYVVSRVLVLGSAVTVLLLPGAAARFLFVREAVLLEDAGPRAALARAGRLAQKHSAAALGLATAALAVAAAATIATELLAHAIVGFTLQMGAPVGELFRDGVSGYALVGFYLSMPLTASARFLKYIDIRTRREGWDIQLRFLSIAASSRRRAEAA